VDREGEGVAVLDADLEVRLRAQSIVQSPQDLSIRRPREYVLGERLECAWKVGHALDQQP
jgi:hypothetical protein